MDAFFIIVAIFLAVTLLCRYAVPPEKAKFFRVETLSEKGLMMRVTLLGKRCAHTTYGFGVHGKFGFKKIFKDINDKLRDGKDIEAWENELISFRSELENAVRRAKSAMRLSYAYKHVDRLPRIYLFCNELVCSTKCRITSEILNKSLACFEKYAPLDSREKSVMADMLGFCLCYVLYRYAEISRKLNKRYNRGVSDANDQRVDLDGITDFDYVCGLIDHISADASSVMRILEENSIDVTEAENKRKIRLSDMYAMTRAVINSLEMLEDFCVDAVEDQHPHKILSKNIIMLCNIMPIAVIALCAILTCVFVSERYAAVCAVVSIIVYFAFRLPVLLYSPQHVMNDPLSFIKSKVSEFIRKRDNAPQILPLNNMFESAYFGGEPDRIQNEIKMKDVAVECDNHGKITVSSLNGRVRYGLFVSVITSSGELDLSCADVVFERYRNVYRAVNEMTELSSCIEASPIGESCIVKISVINRTSNIQEYIIRVMCVPEFDIGKSIVEPIPCGAAIRYESGMIALSIDGAEYGGDLRRALVDNELLLGEFDSDQALIGVVRVKRKGFSRMSTDAVAIHARSVMETVHIAEHIREHREYDADRARAYSLLGKQIIPNSDKFECGEDINLSEIKRTEAYPSAHEEKIFDYIVHVGNGGFLRDGSYVYDNVGNGCEYCSDVTGGVDFTIDCALRGVRNVFTDFCDNRNAVDRALDMPNAFVVVSENGDTWSPTAMPLGKGRQAVVYGLGYTEYHCEYNGLICVVKCGYISDVNVVIIDIKIENTMNDVRDIDIALMLNANGFDDAVKNDSDVELIKDDASYKIYASERLEDFCKFKEGYYVRGKYIVGRGFRKGGHTLYPSLSVNSCMPVLGKNRLSFVIAKCDNKIVNSAEHDLVDGLWNMQNKFIGKFESVILDSSDYALNFMYKWSLNKTVALYRIHIGEMSDIKTESVFLCAIKYADRDFVRRRIVEILSKQNYGGDFGENDGESFYIACAVFDYVEFSQDFALLDKAVPFMPVLIDGVSVARSQPVFVHCLKAIDASERFLYADADDIGHAVCRDAALIALLHKTIDLCKSVDIRRKAYMRLLCTVAERYDRNKSCIVRQAYNAQNGVDAIVYARALYLTGEYGRAYDILRLFNPIERAMRSKSLKIEYGDKFYPMFYTVVTEMMLGIKYSGNRINMSPKIDKNAPTIKFDLTDGEKIAHVTVDNDNVGEWRMKLDTVSYSVSNITLDEKDKANILLYRSGNDF